jgi:hypothetical protein
VWCSNFGHRQFDPAMLHFLERVGVKARPRLPGLRPRGRHGGLKGP